MGHFAKPKKGFTLTEVIVYVSILVIIIFIGTEFIIGGLRSTKFGWEQDEAVQSGRRVIDAFISDVRNAETSDAGNYVISSVLPQSFAFYSDTDSDGDVEQLRYYKDGTTLKKSVIEPSGSPVVYDPAGEEVKYISGYINNNAEPIFTYFDTNNTVIPNPSASTTSIRLVHMRLKINVDPSRAPQDYFVETDVMIRNLKDNL